MTRTVKLTSDGGIDPLFVRIHATEELGRSFEFRIDALCRDPKPDLKATLGKAMTVELTTLDGYTRFFTGIVTEAVQTGQCRFQDQEHSSLSFIVRPKPWLLTRRADTRIFKDIDAIGIVKKLLTEIGYADVEVKASRTPKVREYCVQYRETSFNFMSRLLEQEGLYYYYQHNGSQHTMVIADSLAGHAKLPSIYGALPFTPHDDAKQRGAVIYDWQMALEVRSTHYGLREHDPIKSPILFDEAYAAESVHSISGLELDDYAGEYDETGTGKHYAQVRIEAENAQQMRQSGSTNAFGFLVGGLFKLEEHPVAAQNREHLITATQTLIVEAARTSGNEKSDIFECRFQTIPSNRPFRSALLTPRPVISGLQTAFVTGSEDDEDICVDKYSRVQVKFHWKCHRPDEHLPSIPVRVSTPWAGKQWGMIHIPRTGHEVVVSFMEGNPDRPLIIGSVYNAANMPPYELPANGTQSGVKSRSHKGGGAANFNEFRFEDKKGEEEVYLHAEKDHREFVENDHFVDIGNDETEVIGRDRKHTIKRDEKFEIKRHRTHVVGQEDKLNVGANSTVDVKLKHQLTAGTEIELVTGASSIVMKADGSITIKGVNITIDADVKITGSAGVAIAMDAGAQMALTAGAQLVVKSDAMAEFSAGAMATVKAPLLTLTGDAMCKIGGGIIEIG